MFGGMFEAQADPEFDRWLETLKPESFEEITVTLLTGDEIMIHIDRAGAMIYAYAYADCNPHVLKACGFTQTDPRARAFLYPANAQAAIKALEPYIVSQRCRSCARFIFDNEEDQDGLCIPCAETEEARQWLHTV